MTARRTFIKELTLLGAIFSIDHKASSRNLVKIPSGENIVCVGGHPDDPESGCGGTLLLHAQARSKVSIIYLTRGEAGIEEKTHREAAEIRTRESKQAAAVIGADTYFAGQIDGDTIFNQREIKKLQEILTSLKPDILYTHWPLDSHPDHQVASLLAVQCWMRMDKKFELFFYEVNSGYQTFQFNPTEYVDITTVADRKKTALYKHASQAPESIYDDHHHVMQQFRGREIGVKEAEAFIKAPGPRHSK